MAASKMCIRYSEVLKVPHLEAMQILISLGVMAYVYNHQHILVGVIMPVAIVGVAVLSCIGYLRTVHRSTIYQG